MPEFCNIACCVFPFCWRSRYIKQFIPTYRHLLFVQNNGYIHNSFLPNLSFVHVLNKHVQDMTQLASFFHLSEGGSNLKIHLKRCVFVGRDASDEYAQLLGKLQWLKYSPLPKKRTSKRIDKKNTTSYPIRGWRIFQMITSFFEAIAWFFPFVGIILIIYFPVPWAESQIFWLSPTKKQVPCLVIRNCGPVEQKGDTLR